MSRFGPLGKRFDLLESRFAPWGMLRNSTRVFWWERDLAGVPGAFRVGLWPGWMGVWVGLALCCSGLQRGQATQPDGRDVESRVEDLLRQMTLEEKLGQMTQVDLGALKEREDLWRLGLGSVLCGGTPIPRTTPRPRGGGRCWSASASRCRVG